jgi:hypothetical protein
MRATTYGCGSPLTPPISTSCPVVGALLLCAKPPFRISSNLSLAAVNFPLRVSTSPPAPVAYALPCASASSVLLGSVGSSQVLVAALGLSCKVGNQPHAHIAPNVIGMVKQPRTIPRRVGSWVNSGLESKPCTAREPNLPNMAEIPWHVQRYFVGNISAGIYREGDC